MEPRELNDRKQLASAELKSLAASLQIENKAERIAELDEKMSQIGFWDNKEDAQKVVAEQSKLKKVVEEYQFLYDALLDVETYYEMLMDDFSESEYQQLELDFLVLEKRIRAFSQITLFSGKHDGSNAFLELHPGEGGVDSQDFAQILYRMYVRWAEKHDMKVEVLEYQAGDEAGIKSVVILIKGEYAYGRLKSESGVHRLIRLSPFDTAKRRHTSFASVAILPEINMDIDLSIPESELRIDTFRSSGAGGQSVNTTDSAVRITHLPTGVVASCQNERSQIQNREQAMKILYAKLYKLEEAKQAEKLSGLTGEKRGIGFGSQIRSYVFHPYSLVKDHRTNFEVGNTADVIDGGIDGFIESYLKSDYNTKE